MNRTLDQLRRRRKELGLTQAAMMLRVGMSRQQYQRLESRGNPCLDNLVLLAKGLDMELMLIPREKLHAVRAALEGGSLDNGTRETIEREKHMDAEPGRGKASM